MGIYERYAALYDGSGQLRFALLTADYLRDLLKRHPVGGLRMLDLACGTGTLILTFAAAGWSCVGVDAAPAMLAQGAAKLPGADLTGSAHFLHGDMRDLSGLVPADAFDLATCCYDSLNYLLSPANLAACFRSVAAALAPGGLFVGDMNTRHFLEHDWGECAIQEQSGYTQIERSHYDSDTQISTMLLTGFVGDAADGYERFDELHVERAYPPAEVEALLRAAGLTVEAQYDSFTFSPPQPYSQRIFWVARKGMAAAPDRL